MRLSDYKANQINRGGVRAVIETLPEDVLEQIRQARRDRTHSVRTIVEWLHDEELHGDAYRHITEHMVGAYLRRVT